MCIRSRGGKLLIVVYNYIFPYYSPQRHNYITLFIYLFITYFYKSAKIPPSIIVSPLIADAVITKKKTFVVGEYDIN